MLQFTVEGQALTLSSPPIAAASVNYLAARFSFSDDWRGLCIWAHFKQADAVFDIPVEDDAIAPERGINLPAGRWGVYLHGSRYENGVFRQRVTTNLCYFDVEETGCTWGQEPFPIPPAAASRIEAKAQQALETAAAVEAAARAGAFNGPQGDPGEKGERGDTGPRGADGTTPHIGENGHWYLGVSDTGVSAAQAAATHDTAGLVKPGEDFDIAADGTLTLRRPTDGIPREQLSAAVQASLDRADSALQAADLRGKQDAISDLPELRRGAARAGELTDDYINGLIDTKLGVIENGTY